MKDKKLKCIIATVIISLIFSTGLTTFLFCPPENKADTLPRTWGAVAEQMVKEVGD